MLSLVNHINVSEDILSLSLSLFLSLSLYIYICIYIYIPGVIPGVHRKGTSMCHHPKGTTASQYALTTTPGRGTFTT